METILSIWKGRNEFLQIENGVCNFHSHIKKQISHIAVMPYENIQSCL